MGRKREGRRVKKREKRGVTGGDVKGGFGGRKGEDLREGEYR